MSEILAATAAVVAAVAYGPYIWAIFFGRSRPSRMSWFIWAVASVILAGSYEDAGATSTVWVARVYAGCAWIVFVISLFRGEGGWHRLDIFCLMLAGLGLCVWYFVHQPVLCTAIELTVDGIGLWPTIKKLKLDPISESYAGWILGVVANVMNLIAAFDNWQWQVIAHPLYMIIACSWVVFLIRQPPFASSLAVTRE